MSFSPITSVYDRFNDLEVYENWLDYTLSSVADKPQKVLDVACGTGWFPTLLSPFVDTILAIDIDPQMIETAKAEGANINVEYQVADMLKMDQLDPDFDLVTCYADSLCFLSQWSEVESAIEQMLDRLKPGGVVLFDVWTPYQVTQGFEGFSYFDSDEEGALLWDSEVDESLGQVTHYLTVFNRREDSQVYDRVETQLVERAYPLSSYQALFDRLPIKNWQVTIDFGKKTYQAFRHKKADRWFFRLEKA